MSTKAILTAVFATVALTSCRAVTNTPVPRNDASPASSHESPSSPAAALAAMDPRTPVPLLPMMANHQKQNMRDHLLVVQEIVSALGAGDFDTVRGSAIRFGYSEPMGRMCEHMGAGAPGFTELALHFHHTADGIVEAAKNEDRAGVLKALSATLATCTSCHQRFRQHVVSDADWSAITTARTQPRPTSPVVPTE